MNGPIITDSSVHVALPERAYDITIAQGALAHAGTILARTSALAPHLIIADATVAELYSDQVLANLQRPARTLR